jgi:cytochrome c oxidase subunit 2
MQIRAFTVTPEEFDRWIAHQQSGPAFGASAAAPGKADTAKAKPKPVAEVAGSTNTTTPAAPSAGQVVATPATQSYTSTYTVENVPRHLRPSTPIPAGMTFANVTGDPARGADLYRKGACIGCHVVQGVSFGVLGPNLTHVGSRTTIGAGLYPNDFKHLALWIKNSPAMKPGSLMPAFGKSQQVPGGYTDQQIADIAAYLLSLK